MRLWPKGVKSVNRNRITVNRKWRPLWQIRLKALLFKYLIHSLFRMPLLIYAIRPILWTTIQTAAELPQQKTANALCSNNETWAPRKTITPFYCITYLFLYISRPIILRKHVALMQWNSALKPSVAVKSAYPPISCFFATPQHTIKASRWRKSNHHYSSTTKRWTSSCSFSVWLWWRWWLLRSPVMHSPEENCARDRLVVSALWLKTNWMKSWEAWKKWINCLRKWRRRLGKWGVVDKTAILYTSYWSRLSSCYIETLIDYLFHAFSPLFVQACSYRHDVVLGGPIKAETKHKPIIL